MGATSPDIEIYSIDESFLDLTGFAWRDRKAYANDLRETVRKWTGIPTCVGLGPTKTLAKLANWLAKHDDSFGGVCDFTDAVLRAEAMARIRAREVWGIGPASARKLAVIGVSTAADVAALDHRRARELLTVAGERIVFELRGKSCIAFEHLAPQRKGCAVTRSFSDRVTRLDQMLEAVSSHATRLAEKLRRHGLGTDFVTVFFHTSPFGTDPQHSAQRSIALLEATNDTLELVRASQAAVRAAWREGYRYSKAGVFTTDLVPIAKSQRALFGRTRERSERLMHALDSINTRYGRGTVFPAANGIRRSWDTRFDMRSPRFTTRIDELPVVAAK